MKHLVRSNEPHQVWWPMAVAVAGVLVGSIVSWLLRPAHLAANESAQHTIKPKPVAIRSQVLFTGNIYWGRYVNQWSKASPEGYGFPFAKLNEFDHASYNAWISGLECPTVAGFTQTAAQENATLSFNCDPAYLPEVAKWFTAVSLANNHTDNRGEAGLTETKQQLDKVGIQYFGHPDPRELADICEVVAIPVSIKYDNGGAGQGNLPMALCGHHGFIRRPEAESIAVIKNYAAYMPVVAMPHMGAEYKPAPDQLKIDTYRSMIDSGADMVFGDHPHWIQTSESYRGKPIVYSMGNFIFDQQLPPETTRSAAVKVVFEVRSSSELKEWLELADACRAYHDDCLATIKAKRLKKLPYTYKIDIVGSDNMRHQVKPASAEQQAAILERLGWDETIKGLAPPFEALTAQSDTMKP